MKRIIFLTILLCFFAGSLPAAQKTITVGTSGSPASLDTNFGNAQDNFTELYTGKDDKQPSSLALTTDTSISEAQILANKFITNQGATGEVDLTLPAVSYYITRTIIVTEEQIIELNPPSGEAFDLAWVVLDADDCIDSPAIVGAKAVVTRTQSAAGAWYWSVDVVRGAWVDTGATD